LHRMRQRAGHADRNILTGTAQMDSFTQEGQHDNTGVGAGGNAPGGVRPPQLKRG
jgi:hypothetical protein